MNTEDYEWIGIVKPEDVKPGVVYVTPLAFYGEGSWESVTSDALRQLFPNNGKAAIFVKDFPGNKVGWLWLFQPERNTRIKDPGALRYSHYLIARELELVPLAQIFNWTTRASSTAELPNLLAGGIAAKNCFCQHIYIRFQSYIYGPIKLEHDSEGFKPHEYLQSSNTGGQPLYVFMYRLPEEGILDLTHAYPQLFLLDENILETPLEKEDWSLPQVVIKRVLLASNSDLAEAEVHLVDKRIRELARLSSRRGPSVLHVDHATLIRAQEIVSNQVECLQDLRAIIEQLPAEHPLMQAARTWEIQARSQTIEQEIEARTQDKRDQFQQLQAATDMAQQCLEQANEALDAFKHKVKEQLAMLKEEPLRVLAELQITTSLFPLLVEENRQPTDRMQAQQRSRSSDTLIPHQTKQQAAAFESRLTWGLKDGSDSLMVPLQELSANQWLPAAQQMGVQSKDVRIFAAAFLAGLIPAAAGDAAIPTLKAVAQVIAYGRISVVPVPLTALTTLDLFGMLDLYRQVFVPAAGGLADCILQAQTHPDELVIIVLEGIDRVPGMPVYAPLLRQYIDVRQFDDSRADIMPLSLCHPRAFTPDDPYLKLAWFIWPRNALLAVTLDNDLNSLPLPSVCDRWLARMEPKERKMSLATTQQSAPVCSGISLEQWQTWEQEIRSHAANITSSLELTDPRQKAFHSALTMLNFKEPDDVIEHTWPKQFQQNEEEVV